MRTTTLLALIISAGLLAGCKSPPPMSRATARDALPTRNNAYSLLHQLLDEEKDVSILRFIRLEQTDIKELTKTVSATAKAGEEELDEFAKRDPSLKLKRILLPPGEVKTRDGISKTKEKDLLALKGREFEAALLLSQTDALSYGWHLAQVAAEHDKDPERARAMKELAAQLEALYHRAFDLMVNLPKPR